MFRKKNSVVAIDIGSTSVKLVEMTGTREKPVLTRAGIRDLAWTDNADRRNPEVIGKRRTARIAKGSGTTIQEVKMLLKQFEEMQKMMVQMGRMAKKGKMPRGFPPMGLG